MNVSGKILLLGITDNSINLLTEITDKEVIDMVKLKSGNRGVPVTFTDKIQSLLGGRNISFLKPGNNMNKIDNLKKRIRNIRKN